MQYRDLARVIHRAAAGLPVGCDEAAFQQVVEYELRRRRVEFQRQPHLQSSTGQLLIPDLLVEDVAIELKAKPNGWPSSKKVGEQLASYLFVDSIKAAVLAFLDVSTMKVQLVHRQKGQGWQSGLMNPSSLMVIDGGLVLQGEVGRGPLTQADYEAMKRATSNWRDTLLLMTLRATGFRCVEVCRLQFRDLGVQEGRYWYFMVRRAKRRKRDSDVEPVFISPLLGQPLTAWAQGQNRGPLETLFGLKERQLRNIVYASSLKALGRRANPHLFREFYIGTVANISRDMNLAQPGDYMVASKLVGHTSVKTTMDWYVRLPVQVRIAIGERIAV